jgi:hypothetical protein
MDHRPARNTYRPAARSQAVVAPEAESPSDKFVEVGRRNIVVAVGPDRIGTLVIGQQEQYVGSALR